MWSGLAVGHEDDGQDGAEKRRVPLWGALLVEEGGREHGCAEHGHRGAEGEDQGGRRGDDVQLDDEGEDNGDGRQEAADHSQAAEVPASAQGQVGGVEEEHDEVDQGEEDVAGQAKHGVRLSGHLVVVAEFHADADGGEEEGEADEDEQEGKDARPGAGGR